MKELKSILDEVVDRCNQHYYLELINHSLPISMEDMSEEEIQQINSLIKELVLQDERLEWWDASSQYVNEDGEMVTLPYPIIMKAGAFRNTGEVKKKYTEELTDILRDPTMLRSDHIH